MTAAFSTSRPPTFDLFGNVISSPASAAGPMPSPSPIGPPGAKPGPQAVPVSRYRARDNDVVMPTSDTSGPLFTASSPSAGLQRSLENKLRARMGANGSPEYGLTWSLWDMPSGPPICRLRASARRISGSAFSGWPTPQAHDAHPRGAGNRQNPNGGAACLGWDARLAGWPTPRHSDSGPRGGTTGFGLRNDARLAGWATPTGRDYRHPNARSYAERGGGAKGEQLANQVVLTAGWVSPQARDGANSRGGATVAGRGAAIEPRRPGDGRGHWSDAEWFACLDGKARRIEPAVFPLADGVPGRVGMLRAAGNAIIPQVAAEFIRASIEALDGAT